MTLTLHLLISARRQKPWAKKIVVSFKTMAFFFLMLELGRIEKQVSSSEPHRDYIISLHFKCAKSQMVGVPPLLSVIIKG